MRVIQTRTDSKMGTMQEFLTLTTFLTSGAIEKTKQNVLSTLRDLADELDVKQRDMNIAKTSFATSGIVGTGLAIGGAIAAPFTFGASLGLTIAGATIGVASGLGGLATAIADHIVNSRAMKEAEAAIAMYMGKVEELLDMVNVLLYTTSQEVDDDFSLEENIKEQLNLIPDEQERQRIEIFLRGLRTGLDASGQAAHIGATLGTIGARTSMSTLGAGLKVVRVGGVVLSVLTLPLDLHTLVTNSIKIHKREPSQVAQQIRDMARTLEQHEIMDTEEEPPLY